MNVYKPLIYGAVEWIRTTDLLITNQLLYQLSYNSHVGFNQRFPGADYSNGEWNQEAAWERMRMMMSTPSVTVPFGSGGRPETLILEASMSVRRPVSTS